MKIKFKNFLNGCVSFIVLVCFVSCSLSFDPSSKSSYQTSSIHTAVSKAIDSEMEFVKPNLDPELQASIDEGSKGNGALTGSEIVELISSTEGEDYIDFCYNVVDTTVNNDATYVMEDAKELLPEEKYNELQNQVDEVEKRFDDFANQMVKAIPEDQQYAFYQDLKTLVTRTVVLLTAGIVYACIPDTVLWGKVSAAAAISIGAGLVVIAVMSIYEDFEFSEEKEDEEYEEKDFSEWLDDLIAVPKADFALTSSVTAIAGAMSSSKVAKGICICVFGLTNAYDMIKAMMKKYNFDA